MGREVMNMRAAHPAPLLTGSKFTSKAFANLIASNKNTFSYLAIRSPNPMASKANINVMSWTMHDKGCYIEKSVTLCGEENSWEF